MTTLREHVTPEDFLCENCDGAGFTYTNDPNDHASYRCRPCGGSGMNLGLLADLYNSLSAVVRTVEARTEGDER